MVLPYVSRACMSSELWQLLHRMAGNYTPNERLKAAIVEATLMGMVDQFDQSEVDDLDSLIFTKLHRVAAGAINMTPPAKKFAQLVPAA